MSQPAFCASPALETDLKALHSTPSASVLALIAVAMHAQDLVPRGYLVTPTDSNALVLSYAGIRARST